MEEFFDIVKARNIVYSTRPLIGYSTIELIRLNQTAIDMLSEADREKNFILSEALRATASTMLVDTINELALRN